MVIANSTQFFLLTINALSLYYIDDKLTQEV